MIYPAISNPELLFIPSIFKDRFFRPENEKMKKNGWSRQEKIKRRRVVAKTMERDLLVR